MTDHADLGLLRRHSRRLDQQSLELLVGDILIPDVASGDARQDLAQIAVGQQLRAGDHVVPARLAALREDRGAGPGDVVGSVSLAVVGRGGLAAGPSRQPAGAPEPSVSAQRQLVSNVQHLECVLHVGLGGGDIGRLLLGE
jgi:hypothetical protein